MAKKNHDHNIASFTLLEVIIALGIMVVMVLQISSVMGNSISFSQYERKVTQATWYAKYLMSQVEYKWNFYEVTEMKADIKQEKLPEEICPKSPTFDCNFLYDFKIEEWKLPLIDLAAKQLGGGGSSDGEGGGGGMVEMAKQQIKNILGDEVLKIATVEVFWPEGARTNSVELAYMITAQRKLDMAVEQMNPPKGMGGTQNCPAGQGLNEQNKCAPCKAGETVVENKCVVPKQGEGQDDE